MAFLTNCKEHIASLCLNLELSSFYTLLAGACILLLLSFLLSFFFFKYLKVYQTDQDQPFTPSLWIEKDFFAGRINIKKILRQAPATLSKEEKDFLNQEVEELCELSKEWSFIKDKTIPQEAEDFLKRKKFFGLSIPKEYQGKGFSPFTVARIIEKLSSYNIPLSIFTMLPNSLGPANLILKYGTKKQKEKHLPKLATGKEIPCFALTEEGAGSDAGSLESCASLFKEDKRFKLHINWNKRWISLSAKATLVALVVKLKDPNQLYSKKKDLGITCLLIPKEKVTKLGYHDPMGIPMYNGSISGKNIVLDAEEALIGGLKEAGKGWKMLTESLSSGRAVTLPSLTIGCGKRVSFLTGTHAFVRKQFGLSIGRFEAVQEVLANIAGLTHLMSVSQFFTLSGDHKNSPTLAALTKYNITEIGQSVVKKGMDVMAGVGLSFGPKNKIAPVYMALPLSITVEGANLLTRSFIVYVQGLMTNHPFLWEISSYIKKKEFFKFYKTVSKFLFFFLYHLVLSHVLSLTRAGFQFTGQSFFKGGRWIQKLKWSSVLFAFLSDLNLILSNKKIKQRGCLNGRFADLLSNQYMVIALIWKNGLNSQNPFSVETKWALEYCFYNIQKNLEAILNNFPYFWSRIFLKPLLFLLRTQPIAQPPSDFLNKKLAKKLIKNSQFRKELCANMYFSKDPEDQFQKLKKAYDLLWEQEKILKKINQVSNQISPSEALQKKIISEKEYCLLKAVKKTVNEAIQVDLFSKKDYFN